MNILAVETSGAHIGMAAVQVTPTDITTPVQVRAVLSLAEPRQLSRHIIMSIDAALQQAGWTQDEVDVVAVGLGPGSWTGLRIGLTTCKTLAQVRGWQLAGVPTFDAVAQGVWRSTFENMNAVSELPDHFLLLVTTPCRPGEVYGKIYECRREHLAIVQAEWIGAPQLMADMMKAKAVARDIHTRLVLVGEAAAVVGTVLNPIEQYSILSLPMEAIAVEVARAGAHAVASGEITNPLELQPLYLAPSAAERNLPS